MARQLITLILFLYFTGICTAQDNSSRAFSELNILAGYNSNISNGDLEEYWNKSKGISLVISTPFYFGTMGVGVDAAKFNSKSSDQPNFTSFYFNITWTKGIKVFSFADLHVGIRFGSYNMLFNDNKLSEFETNESELAIAAVGRLDVKLHGPLGIFINPELLTVFTKKRLKLFNLSAGLIYTFDSPTWIKDILE